MLLPNPPDSGWRSRAARRLLGATEPPSHVILTPLGRFYRELDGEQLARDTWLPVARLGETLVVQTPQGAAIVDVLAALPPGILATFAGLCGSLRSLPVGSVVSVTSSIGSSGHRCLASAAVPLDVPPATNVQALSMLDAFQRHDQLAAVADTVDLECALVYAAAQAWGFRARAILAVSDRNRRLSPFDSDPAAVRSAIGTAARIVRYLAGTHSGESG